MAAPIYLELAARARQRHRYVDAESLYSRALSQLEGNDLYDRMLALRGRAAPVNLEENGSTKENLSRVLR